LFRKGLLLIAAPIVFQLVFLAILLSMQRESADAERWALHSKAVITSAEAVVRRLDHESSRVRGLVITDSPVFLGNPAAEIERAIDDLFRLVADNPPQQRRIEDFRAASRRLAAWTAELESLVRAGRDSAAADRIRTLQGERLLEATHGVMDGFLLEEQRLDRQRARRLERSRLHQRELLAAAGVAALGVALLMVRLFSRGISSRLAVVTANAQRLAENAPLTAPLGGQDEIARLDGTLHQSAERLAAAAASERRTQAELASRAELLAAANEELRQKTGEVETFVYSVSHDLRSPLVNLQGFSRELDGSVRDLRHLFAGADLPAATRGRIAAIDRDMTESLRFIQTAVSRSGNIIDALLRLSRAGRIEYQWQPVDVGSVVHRIVDAMRATVEQRGAEVIAGDLPPAWGDPTALDQVFANLIGNALNYLDPSRPGRIEIGARAPGVPGAPITYWVRDNGVGIAEGHQSKLFVAFQRLHGDLAPGEGIGLALTRRIVERHGGKIWVESRDGAGSTFLLTLPAVEPGWR
ncbi:MAG TPA: ATP-binding protein, partial [Thermoanaerobaculia bacterium]